MKLEQLESDLQRENIITHTLNGMARGGMYDLIDGGFCRYSTEESWLIPHFEKMTYDNALLCELYTLASVQFNNPLYLTNCYGNCRFYDEFHDGRQSVLQCK